MLDSPILSLCKADLIKLVQKGIDATFLGDPKVVDVQLNAPAGRFKVYLEERKPEPKK